LEAMNQLTSNDSMWQPIATAPKEGNIIVSGGIAHWYKNAWHSLTGFDYPGRPIEWPVHVWMPVPIDEALVSTRQSATPREPDEYYMAVASVVHMLVEEGHCRVEANPAIVAPVAEILRKKLARDKDTPPPAEPREFFISPLEVIDSGGKNLPFHYAYSSQFIADARVDGGHSKCIRVREVQPGQGGDALQIAYKGYEAIIHILDKDGVVTDDDVAEVLSIAGNVMERRGSPPTPDAGEHGPEFRYFRGPGSRVLRRVLVGFEGAQQFIEGTWRPSTYTLLDMLKEGHVETDATGAPLNPPQSADE
jgi:hypothetical protein